MKKKYIIFGIAAISYLPLRSQDTSFKKEQVNKTEIDILYSHYIQEGDHSAVTGGTGTERLIVYAPGFSLKKSVNKNAYTLKGGVDIVSSASTDNIDYVVSSASKTDYRGYGNFDYSHEFKNGLVVSAGTGFSLESDYLSFPISAGVQKTSADQLSTWSVGLQAYFDDLRYGLLLRSSKPRKLIYPSELRYREWYDGHKRRSYNIRTGYTRVINKKMIIGFFPEIHYQQGLLSTPFHRVYFTDNSLRPEMLPTHRFKALLGIRTNNYIRNTVLKNRLDMYSDNFGIRSIALESEVAWKISYLLTLSPSLRFYHQSGSPYFAPKNAHHPSEIYYTSDYDLSGLNSLKAGMGFRYAPYKKMSRRYTFREIRLQYAYYSRNDGLSAHIISMILSTERSSRKRFILE